MSESEVRPSNSCSINFKLFLPLTDKQGQLQNCYSHQFFFLFTNSAVHADRTFSAAVLHFLLSTRLRRLAAFFRLVLGAFIKSDLSKDALIMGTYSYVWGKKLPLLIYIKVDILSLDSAEADASVLFKYFPINRWECLGRDISIFPGTKMSWSGHRS